MAKSGTLLGTVLKGEEQPRVETLLIGIHVTEASTEKWTHTTTLTMPIDTSSREGEGGGQPLGGRVVAPPKKLCNNVFSSYCRGRRGAAQGFVACYAEMTTSALSSKCLMGSYLI